jgi:hypothetical protein
MVAEKHNPDLRSTQVTAHVPHNSGKKVTNPFMLVKITNKRILSFSSHS